MAKFKVGDRVKFLNENGGGIVSKIISPKLVNVTIEDGFEIPVLSNELLLIELEAPVDSPKHMFREDFNVEMPVPDQDVYEDDNRNVKLLHNPSKGIVDKGVFLAFIPEDQQWLITGLLDVYLVNNTPYEILYNIFLEDDVNGFSGFDYGSVTPESMVLLESLEREKLEKWSKGIVQILFHSERKLKVLNPGSSSFKIKLPRFYKETSYTASSIIEGRSVLISLLPLAAQSSIQSAANVPLKDYEVESQITESVEIEPEHIINKHKTSPREAVVDLHIDELMEDYSAMDNTAILKKQINYFTSCLDNAIENKLHKVTFIHGIGTGVLKTAIKEILKDYSNIEARDASKQQFGYGAIDVILR